VKKKTGATLDLWCEEEKGKKKKENVPILDREKENGRNIGFAVRAREGKEEKRKRAHTRSRLYSSVGGPVP
jgi:hypothetical protein